MTHKNTFFIRFSICIALFVAILCLIIIFFAPESSDTQVDNQEAPTTPTVIIDAGHGGEDGGTQSKEGMLEKDVNLDIALRIKKLLENQGINVILTRDTDTLLYDRNTDYKGRKKLLDAQARLSIGENNPDAIFISIHQNAYKDPQYSGLQVWYSGNNKDSVNLAQAMQDNVKSKLQPDNNRQIKLAGTNIYLMEHIQNPAILIECGFLSNPTEAQKLSDNTYRQNLSQVICDAAIEYLNKNNASEMQRRQFISNKSHGYLLSG